MLGEALPFLKPAGAGLGGRDRLFIRYSALTQNGCRRIPSSSSRAALRFSAAALAAPCGAGLREAEALVLPVPFTVSVRVCCCSPGQVLRGGGRHAGGVCEGEGVVGAPPHARWAGAAVESRAPPSGSRLRLLLRPEELVVGGVFAGGRCPVGLAGAESRLKDWCYPPGSGGEARGLGGVGSAAAPFLIGGGRRSKGRAVSAWVWWEEAGAGRGAKETHPGARSRLDRCL